MNQGKGKDQWRDELSRRYRELWPEAYANGRPPIFSRPGKAAEKLRRLAGYRKARVVAVMPDPVLLQARVNALGDGKSIIAATPGLKQGLVRINPGDIPLARRSRDLAGGAMFRSGRPMRFPRANLGRVDMVIGAALAVDSHGRVLGDGRGLWDLFYHLLASLGGIDQRTPLVILAADEQMVDELPRDWWDAPASLALTPNDAIRHDPQRPAPSLNKLPPKLANLPVVKWVRNMTSGR